MGVGPSIFPAGGYMWERLLGRGGGWGHLLWSLFLSQALDFQALCRGGDRLGADWDPLPQARTLILADITQGW